MTSKLHSNWVFVKPNKGDNDNDGPYLMVIDTPDSAVIGKRSYKNVWLLVAKDASAPENTERIRYKQTTWPTQEELSSIREDYEAQYDVYAIDADEPPTLRDTDEATTYTPYGVDEHTTARIVDSSVITSAKTPEGPPEADEDSKLPREERRTRAQLYSALVEAEKFGNREVRKSDLETNIENSRPDDVSVEYFSQAVNALTQGELVSLSSSLMSRFRQLQLEKSRNESRWRDEEVALRKALQVEAERRAAATRAGVVINIITEGVGYDS